MQDLYAAQLELEAQYHHESVLKSIKQTQDAIDQGRFADIGQGKRIVATAFETVKAYLQKTMSEKRGVGIYRDLLKRVDVDVLTVASLRHVLGYCCTNKQHSLQDVVRSLGVILETEALIKAVQTVAPGYATRTLGYLDSTNTTSVSHRNRSFLAAAEAVNLDWSPWTPVERIGAGRLLMYAVYDTGLFQWVDLQAPNSVHRSIQVLKPSDSLAEHLSKVVAESRSIVKFPPMLVPPRPWTSVTSGGYLTHWYQQRAPMLRVRAPKDKRKWVLDNLAEGKALPLKAAMNKAQGTAYRVNPTVLKLLEKATAMGDGRMGLAPTVAPPQPPFPYADGFNKAEATEAQLEEVKQWKGRMHVWYTQEATRAGQHAGALSRLKELQKYKKYEHLYFPTFVDWRGRIYFRGTLNPQGNDSVKGCLDFAEAKPLGERGLFWLKVHIANCAGYDKHLPELKASWVDQNIEPLLDFFNNPMDVDAPEPDTAFTLYRALLAYTEAMALPDPTKYMCSVPVAMDATCSGLQHFSALFLDPVGGKYTNLSYEGGDQKQDIYTYVGCLGDKYKSTFTKDVVIQDYWKDKPITRGMAKRPVMTYVYASTLKSTMDYVGLDMLAMGAEPVRDDAGDILYSINKLAAPVGKALRKAVEDTVPAAASGMAFLQAIVKASAEPVSWVTPVGMPVVNWSEKRVQKNVKLSSMGRSVALFSMHTGQYHKRKATTGMSPNYIHSMDSAHLTKVLASTDISILPIHDSFGTHPCDVDELHKVLRSTFVELYSEDHMSKLLTSIVMQDGHDVEVPPKGNLNLQDVINSPFMFC